MEAKSKNTNLSKFFLILIGLIIVAGLSFYGGVSYENNHKTNSTAAAASTTGLGRGGRFGGSNRVTGQVTAVSATSISVQNTSTNATTTLAITSSTQISDNGQTVTYSDIQVGSAVFVSENTTNTSQAARILVNPSFGGGAGGGTAPSAGGTSAPSTIAQ